MAHKGGQRRSQEQCQETLAQVLARLPEFSDDELTIKTVIAEGGFSSTYFFNHPDAHQTIKDALKREMARRYPEGKPRKPPQPRKRASRALPRQTLSDQKIQAKFLAYLEQRGVVELRAFCTAMGTPIKTLASGKTSFKRAHHIDQLITPLLPCPECRVEEGANTSLWAVRYYAKPPKGPTFAPRPELAVKTYVDPALKGSWRPEQMEEVEQARKRFQREWWESAQRQRLDEHESLVKKKSLAPTPQTETEKPITESEPMARSPEQCKADLAKVLESLPTFELANLHLTGILKAGGFSSAYFNNNPDQHRLAKDALRLEKARRWREAKEATSALSQEGEGEQEPEVATQPSELQSTPAEDSVTQMARVIVELQEALAALEFRNHELEAQVTTLERVSGPEPDPVGPTLLERYRHTEQALREVQLEMNRLKERRNDLLDDYSALRRALALVGAIDLEHEPEVA